MSDETVAGFAVEPVANHFLGCAGLTASTSTMSKTWMLASDDWEAIHENRAEVPHTTGDDTSLASARVGPHGAADSPSTGRTWLSPSSSRAS